MTDTPQQPDADKDKGAIENDRPLAPEEKNSLAGQNVHRGGGKAPDGQDTDFPEPGSSPEHSGQDK